MVAVLVAVTGAGIHLGAAVLARHRAQAAADLAALAAAAGRADGRTAACDRAGRVARAMSAHLTACTVDGLDVVVTAEAEVPLRVPLRGPATRARAAARAGPEPVP